MPNYMYYVAVFFLGHHHAFVAYMILPLVYEHSQSYLQF